MFPKEMRPIFGNDREDVSRKAANQMAELFKLLTKMRSKGPVPREQAQRLILQLVIAMFAEDIDLLPAGTITSLVRDCREGGQSSYDMLGGLFRQMNDPTPARGGRFQGVPYFNGGLFAEIQPVELNYYELQLVGEKKEGAASKNWSKVNPAIFGTLFQQSMDSKEQHQHGRHFTSEADIQRIVGPTIVRPWQARIDAARSLGELVKLREELARFRVLDPACGSGNFLYVAYREIARLDIRLMLRRKITSPGFSSSLSAKNAIRPAFLCRNCAAISAKSLILRICVADVQGIRRKKELQSQDFKIYPSSLAGEGFGRGPEPMHPRLSLHQVAFKDESSDAFLAFCREAGFANAVLAAPKVIADPMSEQLLPGPKIASLNAVFDPESFGASVVLARRLGAQSLYLLTGSRGALDWEAAAARFAESIAPHLVRGIPILIENAPALYADIHFAHTLADTIRLAEIADTGICIELFACWAEADLKAQFKRAMPRVGLVQVSDYILGDRAYPCRAVPGDGAIPLERLIGDLLDAGYEGVFDIELLGPRIEAEGPRNACIRAGEYMSNLLTTVGT